MDNFPDTIQPTLIPLEPGTTGALELFPSVWKAAESLVSPVPRLRLQALTELGEMGAPRLLPLVAYLVATRLEDPGMEIRLEAVRQASGLLAKDAQGHPAPEAVRQAVVSFVSQMRVRSIYGLLQVADVDAGSADRIARLLYTSPYAGRHLIELLSDRKIPLGIRRQAAHLIGRVGYLEAKPALERLENRLAARANGQQAMPFAPPEPGSEIELLPAVRRALLLLQAA